MAVAVRELHRSWARERGLVAWLATVDHKRIGTRYLVTSAVFFLAAGVEAALMRTQLAEANRGLLGPEAYNELFTMHGLTMIFLFVTPMLSGFGNYLVPLMIGARDMAFPRLNALSYWVFLAAGLFLYTSLLLGKAPNDGWFDYVPLASSAHTPGANIDFYGYGLLFLGLSTVAGAINFLVTIAHMRAPGMSLDRIPLFCWAVAATSFAVVLALPALSAATLMLELDRDHGFRFFDHAAGGDPVLWQHVFWIFGHPDVYIIFLPAVGIVSSVIPVFCRRPMVAASWVAVATVMTAIIGFGVWAHHMFAVGLPQVSMAFFSAASMMITIPSAIQVFAWISTMWRGRPVLASPFLFTLGFLLTFVVGGLTGVMFAVIPFYQQVTDSYFVVAHFHYVLFGGAVFPILAGLHYWFPKLSGRMFDERLAVASFWLVFVGFNVTFFPMHVMGLLGMPRRVYTYSGDMGWSGLNTLSSLGSVVLILGLVAVAANLLASLRRGVLAGPDPWGGNTLEWTTSSPPPPYNFESIPVVRSADPAWDGEAGSDLVLPDGHRTVVTSEVHAVLEDAPEMPGDSLWPLAVAVSLAVLFSGLVSEETALAWVGAALVAVSCLGWNLPVRAHR